MKEKTLREEIENLSGNIVREGTKYKGLVDIEDVLNLVEKRVAEIDKWIEDDEFLYKKATHQISRLEWYHRIKTLKKCRGLL